MLLDAGIYNEFKAKNILITHSHGDHSSFIPFLGSDDCVIYVPENTEQLFEDYINSLSVLNY